MYAISYTFFLFVKKIKKILKKVLTFALFSIILCPVLNETKELCMDAQIKKGAIELSVLHILKNNDSYGYDISERISKYIEVNEGTVYPILRRLNDFECVESYLKESNDGPPRKYYKLTDYGKERYEVLKNDWLEFNKSILMLLGDK